MTDVYPPLKSTLSSGAALVFPTLKPAQIERVAAQGRVRQVRPGEVLIEAGEKDAPFFVIKTGQVEVVQPSGATEKPVALFLPGQFTGEISILFGRRILVRVRAKEAGEVIEIDREHLLELVQTDSELSEIFMRAFILRRVELIARIGDVVFIGSAHCPGTLRVKEFLGSNGHPYSYIDLDSDPGVQELLDHFRHQPGRHAGTDLSMRSRAEQPYQRGDRRLSRLQRGDRLRATARRRHRWRRSGRTRGCGLRGVGRTRRPGVRNERARRTGRFELEDRELPRLSERAFRVRTSQHARTHRRRNSALGLDDREEAPRSSSCDRKPYAIEIDGGSPVPRRARSSSPVGAQYRKLALAEPVAVRGRGRLLRGDVSSRPSSAVVKK